MRRVLVAVVLLIGLTSACGDGTKTVTAGDEPGSQADVCVENNEPYDYTGDPKGVGGQQGALQKDAETARLYGEAHPDEFTLVGFDNLPTVRVVAVFTDHLEQHRDAIRPQLDHPDLFEVRQGVLSHVEAEAIQKAMHESALKHWTSNGIAGLNGRVTVSYRATNEAREAAQVVHERWGRAVCIDVGGHPFPKGAWPDTMKCPSEPAPSDRISSVEFRLELEKTTLPRGEVGTGTARITNHGSETIDAFTGTDIGANVTAPGSNVIIASLTEIHTLAGRNLHAEPGQSTEIPVRFGTEDCAPNSDYSLPPGEYVVSSYVKGFGRSDDVTITIVD